MVPWKLYEDHLHHGGMAEHIFSASHSSIDWDLQLHMEYKIFLWQATSQISGKKVMVHGYKHFFINIWQQEVLLLSFIIQVKYSCQNSHFVCKVYLYSVTPQTWSKLFHMAFSSQHALQLVENNNKIMQRACKWYIHLIVVDSSSYLVSIQSLPRLFDEDALIDSAHTAQRVWLGGHLHGGLLSWNSWGWRKLQWHLKNTE